MPRKRNTPATEVAPEETQGEMTVEQPKVQSTAPNYRPKPKTVEERDGFAIQTF